MSFIALKTSDVTVRRFFCIKNFQPSTGQVFFSVSELEFYHCQKN